MKKMVCFLLATIVLFVGAIPCSAAPMTDRDIAISRACELFPEYASTIRNEGSNTHGRNLPSQDVIKVFEETRDYSDNLAITYTEFSDGTAFISTSDFEKELVAVDAEILSNYLICYTSNLTVYSNYNSNQKLRVLGIEHCVDSLWYDNIVSKGSIGAGSVDNAFISDQWQEWETSSSPAYAKYSADLPSSDGTILEVSVKFELSNGRVTIKVNDDIV